MRARWPERGLPGLRESLLDRVLVLVANVSPSRLPTRLGQLAATLFHRLAGEYTNAIRHLTYTGRPSWSRGDGSASAGFARFVRTGCSVKYSTSGTCLLDYVGRQSKHRPATRRAAIEPSIRYSRILKNRGASKQGPTLHWITCCSAATLRTMKWGKCVEFRNRSATSSMYRHSSPSVRRIRS